MVSDGVRRYVVGPRAVGLEFTPPGGKVFSLGSIQLAYTHPAKMLTIYPELDYETRGGGGMDVPSMQGGGLRRVEFYDVTVSRKLDTGG